MKVALHYADQNSTVLPGCEKSILDPGERSNIEQRELSATQIGKKRGICISAIVIETIALNKILISSL